MPQDLRDERKEDGNTFCCPNGHSQHYSVSTQQQLKEANLKLDQERKRAEWWKSEANKKAVELDEKKKELTVIKKRIKGGVCPCCNRQYIALARHMKTKHPDYKTDDDQA